MGTEHRQDKLLNALFEFREGLEGIYEGHDHADRAISQYFKWKCISDPELRKRFAAAVYQLCRYKPLLLWASGSPSLLQARALHKVLHQWDLLFHRGDVEVPDLGLLDPSTKPEDHILLGWSPDAWHLLKDQYRERWETMAKRLNEPPQLHLRVNMLKDTEEAVSEVLKHTRQSFKKGFVPGSFILERGASIHGHTLYKEGHVEIQDAGSQWVVQHMGVKPGMRIIDACAGAGGKSLAMASIMKNKGKIIALDVSTSKITALKKRAARADVQIIEARMVDPKMVKRLHQSADIVLVDAPCSGSGVVRRNPEIKWRLTEEDLSRLCALQSELMHKYATMVKPGGRLIYCSCSLFKGEGEDQVKRFLETHSGWKLEEELRTDVCEHDADGFYFASLRSDFSLEK